MGLNIIDAVKSGKRHRRKGNNLWSEALRSQDVYYNVESILATDWEIEERKIEITESEFDAIAEDVERFNRNHHLSELKKRLFPE
jgi:hypothetical protein